MRIAVHDYAGHPFQFELSRELAKRGHVVRHFFFSGDPGPKGDSKVATDDPDGFSIEPIGLRMRYRKDKFLRRTIADYLYGHQAYRRIKAFRPDLVISGNTPLDAQVTINRAAKDSNSHFVFWVQDFYSIAIERLLAGRWRGLGKLIARRYRRIEERLLQASHAVVLISPDFSRYLPKALLDSEAIHIIRNWGMLNTIHPREKANDWAHRQAIGNKFVFMYTGTLALKHDPGLLLALSDAFSQDDDVAIMVVAQGVNADILKEHNRTLPRKNLTILPLQPVEDMSNMLGSADVLVAILESDAAEFSVPSKLLSYLCAGRPILLSAPGPNLATLIIQESGGGLHAEPLNIAGFIASARRLRAEHRLREGLGGSGRAYAEANFNIETITTRFEHAFGLVPQAAS